MPSTVTEGPTATMPNTQPMKLLLVEDNVRLARVLVQALSEEGHTVTHARDGESAVELAKAQAVDAVILDWMLPGMDGLAVCQALQAHTPPPAIIMLTARSEVHDRIAGLDAGADDYLTKPFELSELLARLRAVARRRTATGPGSQYLRAGPLRVGVVERVVYEGESRIELTVREHELLSFLVRAGGRVVSRRELLEEVWQIRFEPGTNLIEVQVRRLREKLAAHSNLIETVRGVGYRFAAAATIPPPPAA